MPCAAGGGPVHISSGTAGLALSFFLGRRRGYGTQKLAFRPHSVSHIVIGTLFLWFGWYVHRTIFRCLTFSGAIRVLTMCPVPSLLLLLNAAAQTGSASTVDRHLE